MSTRVSVFWWLDRILGCRTHFQITHMAAGRRLQCLVTIRWRLQFLPTQASPSGCSWQDSWPHQSKWSKTERKWPRVKLLSFLAYSRNWHHISSSQPYWSHRPTLIPCRGDHTRVRRPGGWILVSMANTYGKIHCITMVFNMRIKWDEHSPKENLLCKMTCFWLLLLGDRGPDGARAGTGHIPHSGGR